MLINHYACTPATGTAGRTHYFARELARRGHSVTVVGARRHHLLNLDVSDDCLPLEEEIEGYRFLRLNVTRYMSAHSKRRIVAWIVFALKLVFLQRKLKKSPDVVLYSSPQLVGYLGAEYFARSSRAKLVFEVRDIWPFTLIQVGGFGGKKPSVRLLQWIEDRAYLRSDQIVSNLEGMQEYLEQRGIGENKFSWIPNGVSIEDVREPAAISAHVMTQVPATGLRIVYTGTLGTANALETLIRAAYLVKDLTDVKILLVGTGSARAQLEAQCMALGLKNVRFLGAVPKDQVQSVISLCDVCYIGWKNLDLYKYGIGANKIPEYLYSGRPILHSYSGFFDPITRFRAGFTVPAEDADALASCIRLIRQMPKSDLDSIGRNGRLAALNFLNYADLCGRLENVLVD